MSAPETYFDTPVTRAQVEAGAWVRPEHAALALGCDERTIRRRVRSGAFVRVELGGRVYVRQAPLGPKATKASVEREQSATAALALVVREQANRLEQLAHELALARVAAAHLEHAADNAGRELGEARANVNRLEQLARAIGEQAQREQARATATEAQLELARAQVEHERQRAARLEAIARTPWYAVRVRRRLRRELSA